MKSPIIQKSFIVSFVAIGIVTIATGVILRFMPSISAHDQHYGTSTATATTQSVVESSIFNYKACVDGTADLQFKETDPIVSILKYTYKPIGTHADCASKFNDTAPLGTFTGSLKNCKRISLGESNSKGVSITSNISPFKVHISDNGTGPFDYQFSFNCTELISPTSTSTTSATTTPSSTFTWNACVDAYADVQFNESDPIIKILKYTYKAIGTHSSCKNKEPLGTTTGTLANCKRVELSSVNPSNKLVSLTSAVPPFKVNIKDNGTGPVDYTITLRCTELAAESSEMTFKKGFNAVLSQDGNILDTKAISDAGMYLFDFNRIGQKNWRSTARGGAVPYFVSQIGYYVYNPGEEQTLSLTQNPASYAESVEDKIKVRRGWNLLSNSSDSSTTLANFKVNTLKKGVDAACLDENCFEEVSLHALLSGTPATSRGYGTLFEVTNGNTSDASEAFTSVKVSSGNIDSVVISPNRVFWLYLFE